MLNQLCNVPQEEHTQEVFLIEFSFEIFLTDAQRLRKCMSMLYLKCGFVSLLESEHTPSLVIMVVCPTAASSQE